MADRKQRAGLSSGSSAAVHKAHSLQIKLFFNCKVRSSVLGLSDNHNRAPDHTTRYKNYNHYLPHNEKY